MAERASPQVAMDIQFCFQRGWSTRECPFPSLICCSFQCDYIHFIFFWLGVKTADIFVGRPLAAHVTHVAQALTSLEPAAAEFLMKNGCRKPTHHKVLYNFTVEIDKHCQKVLRETYHDVCHDACNFPDIVKLDTSQPKQFCSAHNKMCLVQKFKRKNRSLYEHRKGT